MTRSAAKPQARQPTNTLWRSRRFRRRNHHSATGAARKCPASLLVTVHYLREQHSLSTIRQSKTRRFAAILLSLCRQATTSVTGSEGSLMADVRVPKRRDTVNFTVHKLPSGEWIVLDNARLEYHSLNEVAYEVWIRCDGQTTIGQLTQSLRQSDIEFTVDSVMESMALLGDAGLLEEESFLDRREFLQTRGKLAAGAAVATVVSITAPNSASAAYIQPCYPCGEGDACYPGPDNSGGTVSYCCASGTGDSFPSRCIPTFLVGTNQPVPGCGVTVQVWGACFA